MKVWADKGQGSQLPLADDLPDIPITGAQVRAAQLAVCARAVDVADATFLLGVLGIGGAA